MGLYLKATARCGVPDCNAVAEVEIDCSIVSGSIGHGGSIEIDFRDEPPEGWSYRGKSEAYYYKGPFCPEHAEK